MTCTVFPTMRYADAPRMLAWLCDVVGFARHAVHEDGKGGIAHAELSLDGGMIMLGSHRDDAFGKAQSIPADLGGTTQSAYLVVSDPDALHARAVAAGAEIVMALRDEDYGSRSFSFRDPEGHLWNIGTYDPWSPA